MFDEKQMEKLIALKNEAVKAAKADPSKDGFIMFWDSHNAGFIREWGKKLEIVICYLLGMLTTVHDMDVISTYEDDTKEGIDVRVAGVGIQLKFRWDPEKLEALRKYLTWKGIVLACIRVRDDSGITSGIEIIRDMMIAAHVITEDEFDELLDEEVLDEIEEVWAWFVSRPILKKKEGIS